MVGLFLVLPVPCQGLSCPHTAAKEERKKKIRDCVIIQIRNLIYSWGKYNNLVKCFLFTDNTNYALSVLDEGIQMQMRLNRPNNEVSHNR